MTFSSRNIGNGLCLAGVALLLLSRTYGAENAFLTEGIHPMDYPRFLLYLLLTLAVLLIFQPARPSDKGSGIPIVTRRTVSMCLSLLLFALLLNAVGFALSAFLGIVLCALIMGYRRYWLLCGASALACASLWLMFTYALKMPLPTGTIW